MKRRSFLKAVGGATGGIVLGAETLLGGEPPAAEAGRVAGLPRRILGRTAQELSVVGFPGLSLMHYDQSRCTEGLHAAFDHGVNYFDVAPAYGNGQCEIKMGVGLQGLDRSRYFLACKTKKRDKAGAREELENSLKVLKTDHFDLYQLHHLRWREEVEQALGPGGAIETLQQARREGKIKYLGFSAHTSKAALAVMKGFRFDTAMFPINFMELLRFGFGKDVLDLAEQQGVAVLSIKSMSLGPWPKNAPPARKWWYRSVEEPRDVELAVSYALSQPGVVAVIPPSFLDLLDKAVAAAHNFRPTTEADLVRLRAMAEPCESLFQPDETRVTWHRAAHDALFPGNPHEGGCGCWT